MTLVQLLPLLAIACFIGFAIARIRITTPIAQVWRLPAALSALFLIFSLYVMLNDSLTGFWTSHTQTLWGNQIWIDLLLAIGTAFAFIVPQARKVGMNPAPWFVLILLTGCIGLLAMAARLLYLQGRLTA